MENLMEWLKGKRTYITAIVYAIAAVLNETGVFVVPDLVFQILAALGLITLRAGVSNV
jgi:hypothetical protein